MRADDRKRNGGLLIPVTLAMVAVGIMGTAMVSIMQTSSQRGVQHSYDEQAYYAARAGVAYARLNAGETYSGAVFSLGNGAEFVLTITNDHQYAYASVMGHAGVGTPWVAHYQYEQMRFLLGTGEGLGPTLADDFEELVLVGDDTQAAWEYPEEQLAISDPDDRLFTTELAIETEQGWRSSNYLTFQNFREVLADQGYIANLVPSEQIAPAARNKDFYGIWGNASDNIYVVGEDGVIVQYDGSNQSGIQWHQMSSPTENLLRAVWGLPRVASPGVSDRMVAVGNNGEMLEYENGTWSRVLNTRAGILRGFGVGEPFTIFDIHGVYGDEWGFITTYGDYGASPYKWPGPRPWVRYMRDRIPPGNGRGHWESDSDRIRDSIWRPYDFYDWRHRMFKDNWETTYRGRQYVFSVGHDRRSSWEHSFIFNEIGTQYYVGFDGMHTANAIWGSSVRDVFVAGETSGGAGRMLHSRNARRSNRWNWMTVPSVPALNGVYGGAEDYVFAGGDDGTLLFYDGDDWVEVKGEDDENITPNNLNSVWGTEQTGLYAVGDNGTIVYLGFPSNPIGGFMLPLNNNEQLEAHWSTNRNFLSYTIQSKMVWGNDLDYAAAGFNFRWRLAEGSTNRYEGYGISFMRYAPGADGLNDYVPNSIKPYFQGVNEKGDRLLVVLWDQNVSGGEEQRRWLAYKDVTADARVSNGGRLRDLSTLMVRVEETHDRNNRVTVYYGNASASAQLGDGLFDNTTRLAYNPDFASPAGTTIWPPFDVGDWTDEEDYFTVVANTSVAEMPVAGDYWILNPAVPESVVRRASASALQGHELVLSAFHSPEEEPFGGQELRPEAGLHVFGDIGDHGTQELLSFAEFRMQVGVDR